MSACARHTAGFAWGTAPCPTCVAEAAGRRATEHMRERAIAIASEEAIGASYIATTHALATYIGTSFGRASLLISEHRSLQRWRAENNRRARLSAEVTS